MNKLNLTVEIDHDSGFCFGVVYAIEMAEDFLEENGYLYCLGDIVHNDEEVKRLTDKGLIIIDHDKLGELKDESVLIRAHGEPSSTYKIARDNNLTLIDASCPVVLKLQNRIKNSFDKKENILIFGKPDHAEVIGLKAQTNDEAQVVLKEEEVSKMDLPEEVTLYSQTTKSVQQFYNMADKIKETGRKVNMYDTICRQVSNRDVQLQNFAKQFSKIVFVAGKKSSNGKVLYNVCKENNPNSFFISSIDELNENWFEQGDSVGICGATSTPMWLMEQVKDSILSIPEK